jgi:hypothetical protein
VVVRSPLLVAALPPTAHVAVLGRLWIAAIEESVRVSTEVL